MDKLKDIDNFCFFEKKEQHKGFYNEDKIIEALQKIKYTDFFEPSKDEECPYDLADVFLCGSCDIFASMLNKTFGYSIYCIKEKNNKGFHIFCQKYKNEKHYYVDIRGITSDFGEFLKDIEIFVNDEYIIESVSDNDIKKWKEEIHYKEGPLFAEAIINKYYSCYKFD